ncbi:TetR/AcrR family transcriptional regulator [Paracraurococcus ruber]|uniref:TetR family transcriptional regulator n=1 Tax=Paracraurococcus ruber TaxID=77675 RepID=A0ABS1CZ25_9PROT|nr:TetR/AcrR family transcriptional regulator [Paracraurococcus ruber]MBK1659192.1 TetR family transcriptional regulator [Paracraurococcus ruber]TDG32835.1 TetR/AcrR family transcriptional regulator [Paracraurococcus ruber]
MARPRAADHEDKRQAILDRAAELFAAHGYDRTSTAMIAEACRVSKALLYHYYKDKSELLFDVLAQHLQHLLEVVRGATDERFTPRERLENVAIALLEAYRDADAVHRVQLACLGLLPPERQENLRTLERAIVGEVALVLQDLSPELQEDRRLLKPATMSLFAMLNWHYLWHREDGAVTRADYARLAAALVAEGLPGAVRELAQAG